MRAARQVFFRQGDGSGKRGGGAGGGGVTVVVEGGEDVCCAKGPAIRHDAVNLFQGANMVRTPRSTQGGKGLKKASKLQPGINERMGYN